MNGGLFDAFPIKFNEGFGVVETSLFGNYSELKYAASPLAWGNKIYMIYDENSQSHPFYSKMIIYDIDTGLYSVDDFPYTGTFGDIPMPGAKDGRFHYLTSFFGRFSSPNYLLKIDLQSKTKTNITPIPTTLFGGSSARMCWGEDGVYTVSINTANGSESGKRKITFNVFKYNVDANVSTSVDTFVYDGDFGNSSALAAITHAGNNVFYLSITYQVSTSDPSLQRIYVLKYDAKNGTREIVCSTIPKTGVIDNLFSIDNSNLWYSYFTVFKDNKIYYKSVFSTSNTSYNYAIWSVYDLGKNIYTTLKSDYGNYTGYGCYIGQSKDYLFTTPSASSFLTVNLLQVL